MSWASAIRKPVMVKFQPAPVFPLKIDWAKLVVLDFETYFDNDYTLKKLSTSEYIRDPRFRAHMVGIKIGTRKTRVIPAWQIKAEFAKIDWAQHDVCCHNSAFDALILSHHYGVIPRTYFDTLSMARGLYSNDVAGELDDVAAYLGKGNKLPDILEMSRGIEVLPPDTYKLMAGYCAQDVDLTYEIFKDMVALTPETEMRLIHMTIRMFADPVLKVDIPRVRIELDRELKEREDLLLSIDTSDFPDKSLKLAERSLPDHDKQLLKAKKIVGSNEKFADLLRNEGVEPPTKISPAWTNKPKDERDESKKNSYAFAKDDAEFLELPGRVSEWSGLDPNKAADVAEMAALADRVQALIDVRLAVKSTTNITRAQRFLTAGANGMSLPVGYAYARAHTYRYGGNNSMNMQNLKRGGELRQSILAPKGRVICVTDSGQIECRVNGWLWDQDDLLQSFREADAGIGRDAYCNFGDIIYNRMITKADKMERFVGKVAVLGLGFMMGAPKFQGTLAKGALGGPPVYFGLDECKAIVNKYRLKNFKIAAGWAKCAKIIEDMASGITGSWKCLHWEKERIWGPDGTSLKYPDLRKSWNEEKGWEEWSYDAKGVRKKLYGGLLDENLVQYLARMIVTTQMLEIDKKRRVVMMTHDEIVTAVPTRSAEITMKEMYAAMRRAPAWCADIPLNCEGGFSNNYSK